jgi:hypothetical protein
MVCTSNGFFVACIDHLPLELVVIIALALKRSQCKCFKDEKYMLDIALERLYVGAVPGEEENP